MLQMIVRLSQTATYYAGAHLVKVACGLSVMLEPVEHGSCYVQEWCR